MNLFIFRCDRAGLAGTIRLAAVRCPAGLAFDIDRQTCDWKSKVESCDRLSSEYFNETLFMFHFGYFGNVKGNMTPT